MTEIEKLIDKLEDLRQFYKDELLDCQMRLSLMENPIFRNAPYNEKDIKVRLIINMGYINSITSDIARLLVSKRRRIIITEEGEIIEC